MKPIAVVVVLSVGWLAAGQRAHGQSPFAAPEPAPLALADPGILPFAAQNPDWSWGLPPLPRSPDAFLWADYRRTAVEHDLDRPWQPRSYARQSRSWPVMSLLSRCFHELFLFFPSVRKHQRGAECGQPTLATMLGCRGGQVATDCGCFPQSPPEVSAPAPLPANEQEVEVPELRPVPIPQTEERQPERTPPYLPPVRSPVVELAPDLVLPPERPSVPLPPNRIPTPGERLPRNVIPPSR